MSLCIMRGQNKLKLAGLIPCCFLLLWRKELDREDQLGPSLACQPKAPTSECLLPSYFPLDLSLFITVLLKLWQFQPCYVLIFVLNFGLISA